MKRKLQFSVTVVLLLITIFTKAQTDFTATYTFGSNGNVTSFAYNGATYDGVTFGNLEKVGVTTSSSANNFRANGWPTGATNGSNDFTGEVDLGKYLGFSVSPVAGYKISIDTIIFGVGRSGTGTRQSQWRGSSDNYAAILNNYAILATNLTNNNGVLTNPDENSSWIGNKLTPGNTYDDLTSPAGFRFYLFNSEATTGTGGFQGVLTIKGTFVIAGGNIPPSITNIVKTPSADITSTTAVHVGATINDTDGSISNAQVKWGTGTGTYPNIIPMTVAGKGVYATTTAIPAQSDGTTVYFVVEATDNQSATSTSAEQSYLVSDPATTSLPYSESFNTNLGDTYNYTVAGNKPWYFFNASATVNGFGGLNPEEHWLVLPGMNLNNYSNEVLTFTTYAQYGTVNANNYLKLFYSTDYTGIGNVALATWTELAFTMPAGIGATEVSSPSGNIDLSAIAGSNVHLAFKYLSTDSPTRFRIDDISVQSQVIVVDNPASFSAVANGSDRIDLTFTTNVAAQNIVIVYNATGTFTDPSGVPPAVGQAFAGGTLLYNGTSSPQSHTGLSASETVYYKAFSYNGSAYSSGLTASATTEAGGGGVTSLGAGDIAFVAFASDAPDRFAFVTLVDISAGTTIVFTDNGFTNTGTLTISENTGTYTAPDGGLTKGSVITVTDPGSGTTSTVTGGGTFDGRLNGISSSGDQIIAYQGTTETPTFITALSTTTWLTTGTITSNSSYLPTGLTNNQNALDFPTEIDNGYYSGITTGTKNALLLMINDPANWTTNNSNQVWPSWTFTVGAGGNMPPSISNIVQNPATGITPSTTVNVTADVTDSDGTISSVVLNWGLSSDNLVNAIPMVLPGKAIYGTSAPIPAQTDGATVYYAITATDNLNGLSTTPVYNYSVSAPATKLAFTAFPATGQQGIAVGSFTVQAQRDDNGVDVNYTGAITLSKASGSGSLTGTLVKNAVAGVATFNDISFDQTGTYTLHADAAGLTQAVSAAITITEAPVLTEVLMPRYIQGVNGTNNNRLPFAYRATLTNLAPNTTYRYLNQVVIATDLPTSNGAGNAIYVNSDNSFTRTTNPSLATAGAYGELTTDANGSYTGWFMNEATGNATRFVPGNDVFMRIILNDGNGGSTAVLRLTATSAVKVINFGTTADATQGTAIRAESNATPKNFMFLYDNIQGTGRPLYGTSIEATGIDFSATSWVSFYKDNVAGDDGSWGGIVPNVNANGVKLLQERALANGSVASSFTSADGMWGTYNTVNPTGGTANVIVIDLTQTPVLNASVLSLSGFSYTEGQGPSSTQSFVISGSNLLSTVVVAAPGHFEVSLSGGSSFDGLDQLNLNASGGTLNNTTIYVRLKAGLTAGNYFEEPLYVASSGAESKTVLLSGMVLPGIVEPQNHATVFSAVASEYNKVTLSWLDATPAATNYLIKGSVTGYNDIIAPVDGVAETNAALIRNVAAGAQTFTFDGLNANTHYYFKIYPYNGTANEVNYKTDGVVPQAEAHTPGGPEMTELLLPQTIISTPNRLLYAFRATLSGLNPNATYKYINQAVISTDGPTSTGAGNPVYVSASGGFVRTTGTSFTNPAQHAEFTTDATGTYTGWFMLEPTSNSRFTSGNEVFMRIRLNNGAGGTTAVTYFTTQAVKVIAFGTEASEAQGTALQASSAFASGNFVFLYSDNDKSGSRPVAGTSVESTGIDFSAVTSYPSYFREQVAGIAGSFGTVIPNLLPSGITSIVEYSNLTGNVVTTKTAANGIWGGVATSNPSGGLNNVIVLNLDTRPTVVVDPAALSGFEYFIGFGPSAEQSFVVSGSNLTAGISIVAPSNFELSLGSGAGFVAQSPLTIPQTNGSAGPVTIFARLKAGLAGGLYSQQVTLTSNGATEKTVSLNGEVTLPALQPVSHLTAFDVVATGMTSLLATWTDALPAAQGYLIKGSTLGYNGIESPADGVVEAEGLLIKYVTAGQQTAVFSGLDAETRYYFKAFAFNGNGLAINYKTDGIVPQDEALTQGTPGITNLIVPRYIQGFSGTNNDRLPFAFRVELKNLSPNTTYRYINQAVNGADSPTSAGAGNPIFVVNNNFYRSSSPSFSTEGQYGEFTTDSDGFYQGWFMLEATGNSRFTPGQQVMMRIRINNGAGGTTAAQYFTTESITVLGFGETAEAGKGTGIRANSSASPKNFVFVYDNTSGTGRPLYGTSVETTGIDYAANTSIAAFYRNNVAGILGSWGGIVPNANSLGVKRVEERSLSNATVVDAKTTEDGFWGLTNTVNPTGGLNNILVLDLSSGAATGKIAGQLKYFNAIETTMPSPNVNSVFYVQLMENGVAVRPRQLVRYNQTLGLDAYYEFANVESGRSYSLRVWEQTQDNSLQNTWAWNNWGGVTALDALISSLMTAESTVIEQLPWIAPTNVPNYTEHFFNVADVNNSANLTAADALLLQYRMINEAGFNPLPGGRHNFQLAGAKVASHASLQYPQAPATIFLPYGIYAADSQADEVYYEALMPVTETGLNVFNVYYNATGDLNASYVPGPALRTTAMLQSNEQVELKTNELITIPLMADQDIDMAAMTLELHFDPQLIDVIGVDAPGYYMVKEGVITVSWFDRNALNIRQGESLVRINAVAKAGFTTSMQLITLGGMTEFADSRARIIEGVQLKTQTFVHNDLTQNTNTLSAVMAPNPFSYESKLMISLAADGQTTLVVYNAVGQEVHRQVKNTFAGETQFRINAADLEGSGIYFYQLMHQSNSSTQTAKGSFVVR